MKARLAFSMGAIIDPNILIIDETLSVGDVFFAQKATQRMKEISRRGRIVIVVSHGLGFIDDMCTRCLWLDQGKLVMDGHPADVTRAYQGAVEQADEAELSAKFGAGEKVSERPDAGRLQAVTLEQEHNPLVATARAFVPLHVIIRGEIGNFAGSADIRLSILRVDGRRIMSQRLSEPGEALPQQGLFTASVAFDPLILGAGLYRFDVTLMDADGSIDTAYRVVEILDEEGQFGGVPLLYCPPIVSAKPLGESS
jgi:lipopolysaccharide transport system ATP-binding protein